MKNKKLFWIFALSASVYFTQGIEGLPGQAFFYYLKETLGWSPSTIMYIGTIVGIAWLIKPLWGYLMDVFKLKKRDWILLNLLIDSIASLLIGVWAIPIAIIIALQTMKSMNAAFRDVAVDGLMVVEGQKNNCCGRIQSVQWIAITIASILTGIGGGYIAEHFNFQIGYLLLIPIFVLVAIPALLYKEDAPAREKFDFIKIKNLVKDKRYLIGGVLFMFFYCYSPSFGTPLLFIQRDTFHWSKIFIGVLGTILSIVEIVGALLYYKFSKRINVRKWLVASVFIGATTTMCYLYYTPVTAIIYGILFCVVGMFIHLILMDYVARICPKGLEATAFALLCSVHNLAGTASTLTGAALLPLIGLKPLIIIASLTSFVCLAFIKYVKVSDNKLCQKNLITA